MKSIEKSIESPHRVVILLGSNIHPAQNLRKAIELLSHHVSIIRSSRVWETAAVGSDGPNFLNQAIEIESIHNSDEIKNLVIKNIETALGRVRTSDKNAPRTIDLDIILFDEAVFDHALWEKAFIAVPVSEINPELKAPDSRHSLAQIAAKLKSSTLVELFNERDL